MTIVLSTEEIMKLKVEVVTTPNSNKKITESLLQLLSKYEKTIFEKVEYTNKK